MLWYTREASVAVYVANLPGIWPLLREHFRFLREKSSSYVTSTSAKTPQYGYGSQYGNLSVSKGPRSRTTRTDIDSDEIELGKGHSYTKSVHSTEKKSTEGGRVPFGAIVRHGRPSQDSDERALREAAGGWGQMGLVQVEMKVEIERNSWDARESKKPPGVHVKCEGPGDAEKR